VILNTILSKLLYSALGKCNKRKKNKPYGVEILQSIEFMPEIKRMINANGTAYFLKYVK